MGRVRWKILQETLCNALATANIVAQIPLSFFSLNKLETV